MTAGLKAFGALATGGKTTPSARLRRDLRVIDGETLLQKLSDYSCSARNFAIIAGHSVDVPLPHARLHVHGLDGIGGGRPGFSSSPSRPTRRLPRTNKRRVRDMVYGGSAL